MGIHVVDGAFMVIGSLWPFFFKIFSHVCTLTRIIIPIIVPMTQA